VEFNGTREADGFASQAIDARSERQVVTFDTMIPAQPLGVIPPFTYKYPK